MEKYYFTDIESGELFQVSKEFMEARAKFIKMLEQPDKIRGNIIITSTSADDNTSDDFRKLWTNQQD